MQALQSGYRGLELIVELNLDRAFFVVGLAGALFLGAWLGS